MRAVVLATSASCPVAAIRSSRRPSCRRWVEHSNPPMKKLSNRFQACASRSCSALDRRRPGPASAMAGAGHPRACRELARRQTGVALLGIAMRVEQGERLADHLVHVVVAVGGEPAHEVHVRRGVGQRLVLAVQLGVLRPRHRIVRIALGRRVLVGEAGLRVLLPGQVLVLGDPGVGHLFGRVVHHRDRLEVLLVQRLVAELERAVGQLAEAVVEILVDRARCRSACRSGPRCAISRSRC